MMRRLSGSSLPMAARRCVATIGSASLVVHREKMKDELAKSKSAWRDMHAQKQELDRRIQAHPENVARGIFAFIALQNAVLFEWTFFRFDWNLVEPITYLLGYSTMWLGIACFFSSGKEWTYDSMRASLVERQRRKVFSNASFDEKRYDDLTIRVGDLEERIKSLENL